MFWTDAKEPHRQFRWLVSFIANLSDEAMGELSYMAKKCDLPKAKLGSVEHVYFDGTYKFPGDLQWEDINITLVSTRANVESFVSMLRDAGYYWPSVKENYKSTISKDKFRNAIQQIIIYQIKDSIEYYPEPQVQRGIMNADMLRTYDIRSLFLDQAEKKWSLINPFFTSIQFGSLDYGSEEIVEIQCTIKYDSIKGY